MLYPGYDNSRMGPNFSSTWIDEKSRKITEMQKVMKQIDCSGCIVTADDMESFFKNFKNTFDNLIFIGYYIEESLIACVSAFLVVGAQLYFVKNYLCKMIETCPISD